jgi:hypothetical protein
VTAPEPTRVDQPAAAAVVAFAFTRHQRRRSRLGLIGLAGILWSAGIVRFALDHRLSTGSGWAAVVGLAVLLAFAVLALSSIQPLVALTDDAVVIRRGPRHHQVLWRDVTDIELRERGTARRVVLHRGEQHAVLPVPLTGGSLIGPGADPELDHKVEVIRRRWQAAEGPPDPIGRDR